MAPAAGVARDRQLGGGEVTEGVSGWPRQQQGPNLWGEHGLGRAKLVHPVIVGYDGSMPARHALAYAAGTAWRLGRPLLAVYVTASEVYCQEPLTGLVPVVRREAKADEVERWLLTELGEMASPAGLEVHCGARRGSPAHELAALATELKADALVIGAPARSWHHLAGSVPGWLARHASCPVIVIP